MGAVLVIRGPFRLPTAAHAPRVRRALLAIGPADLDTLVRATGLPPKKVIKALATLLALDIIGQADGIFTAALPQAGRRPGRAPADV